MKHAYNPDIQIVERDVVLVPVHVHGECPTCSGELHGTGYGLTTNKTKWVNRCEKCGDEFLLDHSYPYLAHREGEAP